MVRTSRPRLLRRKFIVDRRFQYEMMLRAVIYSVAGMSIMGIGIFYPVISSIKSGEEASDASTAMLYLHEHFWPVALLCVVLALLVSVQLSHRIAGPLYRIKQQLESLSLGVIPGMTATRKRDYLKDEVETLNRAMASLSKATKEIKALDRDLARELAACGDLLRDYEHQELKESFDRLEQKAMALHQGLDRFHDSDAPVPEGSEGKTSKKSAYTATS